ncbi:acyltransferase [Saccharicrinis aurantiacus]|uniref:acyltransferase n=1 Tax=Saccharicrinis aurantiacus TaxID=1849719 RepID=UPI0015C524B9|nr:acyltransferase [Saccharicrinis aurantiacus]
MKLNNVKSSSTPKLNGRLYIKCKKGSLLLGKNVKINSGKKYNVIGGDTRTNFIISPGATMQVGNNVGISNSTFCCHNSLIIEDNVLFGGGCKVYDTDFHSINFDNRILPYRYGKKDKTIQTKGIIIKRGAWVGGHCIILKGVKVGENSIIGAGSVVTKSIPPNEIWAGNPAKFIKRI